MQKEITQEQRDAINYRFSGYTLPMIQLDSTGPSYIQIGTTQPYYVNQPEYWSKQALTQAPKTINNQPI